MSIEDPNIIDFVAHDPSGQVVLVMVEGREWDGSDERIFELQEKINSYATFACDGQLIARHPDLAGKSVRLELRCIKPPDSKTTAFLDLVSEKLKEAGLGFTVQQIRDDRSG